MIFDFGSPESVRSRAVSASAPKSNSKSPQGSEAQGSTSGSGPPRLYVGSGGGGLAPGQFAQMQSGMQRHSSSMALLRPIGGGTGSTFSKGNAQIQEQQQLLA